MFTGTFLPPEVVAFSALPHLLPFIILKENVHNLAVLISEHHGPVVFGCGDGTDVDSSSNVHLNNRANGRGGWFFIRGVNINARFPIAVLATGIIFWSGQGGRERINLKMEIGGKGWEKRGKKCSIPVGRILVRGKRCRAHMPLV